MRHFFMEIDGMTVTYGDIVEERLCDTVPSSSSATTARGISTSPKAPSPTCTPVKSKGFSESELWDIESLHEGQHAQHLRPDPRRGGMGA